MSKNSVPSFTVKGSAPGGIILGEFQYNSQKEWFRVKAKDFDELREVFHGYLDFLKETSDQGKNELANGGENNGR